MPNPDGCRASEGGSTRASPLPLLSRLCHRAPARGHRHLHALLRARSTRSTTGTRCARRSPASASRPGPPSIWRYADLLPVAAPERAAARAGLHAARARAAARRGARDRRALAQARHRQPDALVQGPRRRGRGAQGAGARPRRRSRARRPATSRAPSRRARRRKGSRRRSSCPADLEPEKLAAAAAYGPTIYAVDGTTTTARASRSSSRSSCPGDSSTSTSARTTPRGRRRSPTRSPSSSAGRRRTSVAIPIASGALFHKVGQGFAELRTLGLVDGVAPSLVGGQAEGCQPVATAFREGTPVTPVRPTRSPARSRSAAPRTATSPSRPRARPAARSTPSPRTRSARTWRSWPRRPACSARRRRGVTLGALRAAVAAGERARARPRRAARHRRRAEDAGAGRVHVRAGAIAADADAFLDRVLAAA